MAINVKVGDKAPDFTLPDIDMKPRSLKEFLGKKVVLAFFVALSLPFVRKRCVLFGIRWRG